MFKYWDTCFLENSGRPFASMRRSTILLKNKPRNIVLQFIRIVNLKIDLTNKRKKQRYDAFVCIADIINASFVFPISLLLVIFPINLPTCWFSWLLLPFPFLFLFLFELNSIKLSSCFCFNFLIVVLLHQLFVSFFLFFCFLIINMARAFVIVRKAAPKHSL
jgi:hypothetical protein